MAAAPIEIVTLASKSEGHFTLRLYVGQTRTFGRLDLPRVISLIRPENVPSQGVARKLGMVPEKSALLHGRPHLVFAGSRATATAGP